MIDLLSICNAQSKNGAALSVQQNNKMVDRSGLILSPLPPLPCIVTRLLIFEEKGWVISDTIYARVTKQYCLNTKQQITLKFMIMARKLSELNPIKDHCTSDMKLQSSLLLLA